MVSQTKTLLNLEIIVNLVFYNSVENELYFVFYLITLSYANNSVLAALYKYTGYDWTRNSN